MGFDLKDGGFHIVLSKDVPQLIRENIREPFEAFLAQFGLQRSDIAAFVLHPGGQKLLQFMEEELGLAARDAVFLGRAARLRKSFERLGALRSAGMATEGQCRRTARDGLLAAFGPGFSAEMLLLEWA